MIVLDTTIVNVALPSIRADLGFSETSLAWVVNAYLLTFGGFLLLGGRLGDLYGHRRLFLIGIALFTLASIACGLAGSQEFLIGARAVQGLGGAIVSAVSLSLMMSLFTEPAERAKAMGVFGFVAAGGGSIGVLLGGMLTDVARLALDLPRQRADRGRASTSLAAGCSPRPAARPERRLDVAGRGHRDAGADARRLRDRQRQRRRLDVGADARPPRRRRPCSSASSSSSSPASTRHSCRSACSGFATSRPRTSSASSGPRRCSPGSSSRRSTSSSCSGTARSRSGSPSCPPT